MFLSEMGLGRKLDLTGLIRAGYELLALQRRISQLGRRRHVRGQLKMGPLAPQAAGEIHGRL